jgi:hypothetical protein
MPSAAALLACALLLGLLGPLAAAAGGGGTRPLPSFASWLAEVQQQVELAQQWKQGRVAAGEVEERPARPARRPRCSASDPTPPHCRRPGRRQQEQEAAAAGAR